MYLCQLQRLANFTMGADSMRLLLAISVDRCAKKRGRAAEFEGNVPESDSWSVRLNIRGCCRIFRLLSLILAAKRNARQTDQ